MLRINKFPALLVLLALLISACQLITRPPASEPQTAEVTAAKKISEVRFAWSSNGAINGLYCSQIHESREPVETSWGDNYLCSDNDLGMRWSSAGPIPNMDCVQWHESREPPETSWHDNYFANVTLIVVRHLRLKASRELRTRTMQETRFARTRPIVEMFNNERSCLERRKRRQRESGAQEFAHIGHGKRG